MTLVYENLELTTKGDWSSPILNAEEPVLHACIIGIGRFSKFSAVQNANRPACADSARAMVEFLVKNEKNLIVPLGSIECLISDPRDVGDSLATLIRTHESYDPRPTDDPTVAPGTKESLEIATNNWLSRIRKGQGIKQGDHLLLYVCSHGVAGRDKTALAVLEDTNPNGNKPYDGMLDIDGFSLFAPAKTGAGASWVFLDACQEIVGDVKDTIGGVSRETLVTATTPEREDCDVRSFCLVGSRYGQKAFAPEDGGIAYFTQALIVSLETYCVEKKVGGWTSTSLQLQHGVEVISSLIFTEPVETEVLHVPRKNTSFIRVVEPKALIKVSSFPGVLLLDSQLSQIRNLSLSTTIAERPPNQRESSWFCPLDITNDNLIVSIFNESWSKPTYEAEVVALPPGQNVMIE